MSGKLKPGWTRVRFGEVVRLNKDRVADPLAAGIERYVGIEHIEPEDLRIRRWGLVAEGTTFTNYFKAGQVLFVKRRAYQRKVAVADFEGVCSGDIYVLESKDPDMLLPELLPFICQTDAFFEHAVRTSAGSLSPRTNWKQLADYEFALPPLAEQRRIAKALLAAEKVVNRYSESLFSAIRLRSSIRKAEFDPRKYRSYRLSELCENGKGIQIGPFGAQLHQTDYVDDGIPVIMPANMVEEKIIPETTPKITEEKARELSAYRVQPGDILLPRRGELDRRVFIEEQHAGWLCGTGSVRIRVSQSVSSKAVFQALASAHTVRWLVGNAVGTTMPNLNSKIVGRIPIALPPPDRQKLVIEHLDSLTRRIVDLQNRFQKARQIKAALLDRLVGGA